MTVWVAMPAYNEAPRLPALLARWVAVFAEMNRPHRYVIVDDGSSDETPSILAEFADQQPAEIVTHRPNQGLGASLRDALRTVANHAEGDDVIVMMDADNTMPPTLFPRMLNQLRESNCDVVIASRYRSGARVQGLSPFRRLMSFGARVLFQIVFPIRGVRDYTCGYRVYRVATIQRAFATYGDRFCDRPGFDCTADIILRLAKLGARFAEVPLELNYEAKRGDSTMDVGGTVGRTIKLMITRRLAR